MWNYFKVYGDTGGHSGLVYVDSYKGDDANPGTHLSPKQTLQGGFDVISDTNARLVCAGFFKESNFVGVPTSVKILAEGYVLIDFNNNATNISVTSFWNTLDNSTPTSDFSVVPNRWDYGYLHLKNIGNDTDTSNGSRLYYNCFFDNVTSLTTSGGGVQSFNRCILKNVTFNTGSYDFFYLNCTFIGGSITFSSDHQSIKNSIFQDSTKLVMGATASNKLTFNLFLGSYPDRIIRAGVPYNDIEALQAAGFADVSNLPSNTDPKFNGMNPEDLTLQPDSPLIGAGENGVTIGAYNVAVTQAADSVNWTLDFIDNTTNPQGAILAGATVGTLTATTGIQLEATGKRAEISRTLLPGSAIDPELGETINSQLGTEGLMPSLYSIEIQYSIDGGSTYNGTWLKVPYGMRPLHDTTNDVGNADENFVNGAKIKATHILPRITLRSDDF